MTTLQTLKQLYSSIQDTDSVALIRLRIKAAELKAAMQEQRECMHMNECNQRDAAKRREAMQLEF